MGMQPDDLRTRRSSELVELVELEQRDAEFRMHASGLDVLVVTPATPWIEPDEKLLVMKEIRPVT